MFSAQDITIGMVDQTVATTMPTTGNLLMVDYIENSLVLTKDAEAVESTTMKPFRAGAGQRRGKIKTTGQFKFRIHGDDSFEKILASLLSGTWLEVTPTGDANDTLKPGVAKKPFALVIEMADEFGVITKDHVLGCEVTKITFSAENSAGLEATVDFTGIDVVTSAGASTLTRVASANTLELIGDEVVNITVNGAAITTYTKFDLTIEQPKEGVYVLGSTTPIAVSNSAGRTVSGSLSYLRQNGALPGFTGAAQGLTFNLSTFYSFNIPAIFVTWPKDSYSGSILESSVDFVAGYDNTLACDIMVTRL